MKGELVLSGSSEIHGQIEGMIISEGELFIGPSAIVGARISAETLRIAGSVVGRVDCSVRLELLAGARVAGDISAPVLVVQDGVLYEGACRMPKPRRESDREEEVTESEPEAVELTAEVESEEA